ncbi:MAG: zinc ribbon domain-containing protein [Bifidobacteriaceae bacterium]|jgi:RNA polymerase subunit RPABC4/transcription elongation factor Spt4|nr:zinc ribbon domain-containing protein [Bifidobacteriaceae bacterium]
MAYPISTVKAGKENKQGGRKLSTDGNAQIRTVPEDGQVEEFRVSAVNPIHWFGGLKRPDNEFSIKRMDAARSLDWRVFVTDSRILFWAPEVATFLESTKIVPGKATAGQFLYEDVASISYGFSAFEASRAMWDADAAHTDETAAADGDGTLTISIVYKDSIGSVEQTVATIEAGNEVLRQIVNAISLRVQKLPKLLRGLWCAAVPNLLEADFGAGSGRVIVNPQLDSIAPIEPWLEARYDVSFLAELKESFEPGDTEAQTHACTECGESYDSNAQFCPACGAPSPRAQPAQPAAFCMNCGGPLAGARFCPNCGTPAGAAAGSAGQQLPAAPPTPTTGTKLILERRKAGLLSASNNWSIDVLVDGLRVDSLFRDGARVTIERGDGFVCFLRCDNEIYKESSEMRIRVPVGETRKVAVVYKKAIFGYALQQVPW